MKETYFEFDQAKNKWVQAAVLPALPAYTVVRCRKERGAGAKRYSAFCRRHGAMQNVCGIAKRGDGRKMLVASCGCLMPPPYLADDPKDPFAYSIKTYNNKSFVSFAAYNVGFVKGRKVRNCLNFMLSTATGELENVENKFDVENDNLAVPLEVLGGMTDMVGESLKEEFGFVPTLTSKFADISVIRGYVKYPFNANLAELKKVSGMDDFIIDRKDPLNENKMYEFLGIKPSKVLRKKYAECPFAPIAWKFFERFGFKDVNLTNPLLDNADLQKFLKDKWVRYDCDAKQITFRGEDKVEYFAAESLKRNSEKTALSALMVCIKTASSADYDRSWIFFDTLDMLSGNFERISDDVKKEIFHDGITRRTHDNMVALLDSMGGGIGNDGDNPFPYAEKDFALEYEEIDPKTGKVALRFVLPKNKTELLHFGKRMHNCVAHGGYTESVYKRTATIVAVYANGKPDMCLELNVAGKVVQALGVCNAHLNFAQRKSVRDWALRNNLNPGVVRD